VFARALAPITEKYLGQPIAIVNIPGASGAVGMVEYMKRPADGYSILGVESDLVINSALGTYQYTVDDLDYLIRAQMDSSWILVRDKSPFKRFEDVVAKAKESPDKLLFGGIGLGSNDALAVTKLASAGVKMKFVSYDGGGELHAALLRGEIDLMWEEVSETVHYVQGGQMRALAAANEEKIKGFQDLPTLQELGYDIAFPFFRGVAIKKGVDPAIRKALEDAFGKAIESDEWKEFQAAKKLDQRLGYLNSTDFERFIKTYYRSMKEVVEKTGYKGR
jgi:tripartite-type tricarboxylate transporter receptor subunit TctC